MIYNSKIKEYQPIFVILLTSLVAFLVHKLAFFFLDYSTIENSFQYTLFQVYSFFLICSIFIVLILIQVKKRDINNVGNGFLLLTLLKIGIAFIFANPIVSSTSKFKEMERMDFFIVFAIFLTIETVVTIRILNNKQQNWIKSTITPKNNKLYFCILIKNVPLHQISK